MLGAFWEARQHHVLTYGPAQLTARLSKNTKCEHFILETRLHLLDHSSYTGEKREVDGNRERSRVCLGLGEFLEVRAPLKASNAGFGSVLG